jgi:hypothetical protein
MFKLVRLIWDFGPNFGVARSVGDIEPTAAVAVPPLVVHWDGADAPTRQKIEATLKHIMPRSPGATIAGSIAAMRAGDSVGRFRAAYELVGLIEEITPELIEPGEPLTARPSTSATRAA